jgi:sirohydrochlorin ferrochelatase
MSNPAPALFVVGHGTRDADGVAEFHQFLDVLRAEAPHLYVHGGFIELAQPDLDTAIDEVVASGGASSGIVAVPLVLLGAGHMKNDGPAALARARQRHPDVPVVYGRELGVHPTVLALAEARIREAMNGTPAQARAAESGKATSHATVLVSRGSSDPDANSDLHKACRLVWDHRDLGLVEPAFVSLAPPDVAEAMERCRRLGATAITVVPYFLFTGVLPERIGAQARAWGDAHPDIDVRVGRHLGPVPPLARLVLERYEEARRGDARMNCDLCTYRTALPGYEARVGSPLVVHSHHHHHDHAH